MLDAMHSCHLSDFPSGLPLCIAPQHLRPRTESPKTPSTLAIIWPWAPKSAFLVTGTCTLPEGLLSYLVVYTTKLAIQRAKPWDASLRLGSLAHRQTLGAKTFDTGRAQPPLLHALARPLRPSPGSPSPSPSTSSELAESEVSMLDTARCDIAPSQRRAAARRTKPNRRSVKARRLAGHRPSCAKKLSGQR